MKHPFDKYIAFDDETGFYNIDFNVIISFDQDIKDAKQIESLIRHIPRYWTVDQSIQETLNMLATNSKVVGKTMMMELPLADESKERLLEIADQLKELLEAKVAPGRRILTEDNTLYEVNLFGAGPHEELKGRLQLEIDNSRKAALRM